MIVLKLRKRLKKDGCPPERCPLNRRPGCCIVCEFHIERGRYIVYCAHKNAWRKE